MLDNSRKWRFRESECERSIGSAEGKNKQTGPKWDNSKKEDFGGTLRHVHMRWRMEGVGRRLKDQMHEQVQVQVHAQMHIHIHIEVKSNEME
jgi:hypothetical protein